METIKATKHDQALKELNAIDRDLAKSTNLEVSKVNRKYHHAILVRVQDRPGQVKNKVTASVQTYHKGGFDKIVKNPAFFGCSKVILLHDPALLEEDEEVQVPQHVKTAIESETKKELKADIDAEVEKRVQARMDAYKKEQTEKSNKITQDLKDSQKQGQQPADVKELTDDERKAELEDDFAKAMAGNKPELEVFLNKYKIGHGDLTNNEGRTKRIKAWFETEMAKFEGDEEEVIDNGTDNGDGGSNDGDGGTNGDDNGTNEGSGDNGSQA